MPKMFWIARDGQQCLDRRFEPQAIDRRLVLIGDIRNLGRKREHDADVFDRQQILHPRLHPVLRRRTFALINAD